jgi:hypothetical protein
MRSGTCVVQEAVIAKNKTSDAAVALSNRYGTPTWPVSASWLVRL